MNYEQHGSLILTATLTSLLMSLFLLSFFSLLFFFEICMPNADVIEELRVKKKEVGPFFFFF